MFVLGVVFGLVITLLLEFLAIWFLFIKDK